MRWKKGNGRTHGATPETLFEAGSISKPGGKDNKSNKAKLAATALAKYNALRDWKIQLIV